LDHAAAGQYWLAASDFEQAYATSPHPSVLYNLAQAWVGANRPARAIVVFERYLRESGDAIDGARRAEVEDTLRALEQSIARWKIAVNPAGASVEIDGEVVDTSAPLAVDPGPHVVRVSAPGFEDTSRRLRSNPGQPESFTFELKALPASSASAETAFVRLSCAVPQVKALVDGAPAPLNTPLPVAPGPHRVQFQRLGYQTDARTAQALSRGLSEVSCRMVPKAPLPAAESGKLRVSVQPARAELRVNGESSADHSPELPIGPHALELRLPGYVSWQREITLGPREPRSLEVTLAPTPAHAALLERRERRERWLTWGSVGLGAASLVVAAVAAASGEKLAGKLDREQKRLDARWRNSDTVTDDLLEDQARNDARADDVARLDKLTIGFSVAGGLLVLNGAVLLLTGHGQPE
jgi:hypothetical protein